MLTAYKHSTTNEIVETNINQSASWINVVEPDREEIEHLIEQYNLPEDFIRDPLDADESARIEYDEDTGYSLIIVDLPIVKFYESSCSLICYHSSRYCDWKWCDFTICDAENEFLENYSRQDNVNLKFHSRFALDILLTISNHYNRNLRLLNKSRIRIERDLKNSITNKQLYRLMEVEKVWFTF